jgi:hypothetical protein
MVYRIKTLVFANPALPGDKHPGPIDLPGLRVVAVLDSFNPGGGDKWRLTVLVESD